VFPEEIDDIEHVPPLALGIIQPHKTATPVGLLLAGALQERGHNPVI
jgi:hypothetical protein